MLCAVPPPETFCLIILGCSALEVHLPPLPKLKLRLVLLLPGHRYQDLRKLIRDDDVTRYSDCKDSSIRKGNYDDDFVRKSDGEDHFVQKVGCDVALFDRMVST